MPEAVDAGLVVGDMSGLQHLFGGIEHLRVVDHRTAGRGIVEVNYQLCIGHLHHQAESVGCLEVETRTDVALEGQRVLEILRMCIVHAHHVCTIA